VINTVTVFTVKTPDDGQRNCPKHVEFYSKNKFEKVVQLVGFIIKKSRRMRWAGHTARLGERSGVYRWGSLRELDHLGDPDVDRKIILRWIFRKWDVWLWTGSSWLRI